MCGIAGFNWDDKNLVKKMADLISYRGPDDSGVYTDKNISLGHRRLSILDLTKTGHQPMINENGDVIIVFNGEIYNFKSIKEELLKKGHRFNGSSDTEAIIHGYGEFGEKIFSMLEGMFAIALWDVKKKKLFLARDKIGKKPLYYYFNKKKLIFASEIKAILLHNEIKREINPQCLSDYLSMRFSPGTETMFKGIAKIPPGYYLCLKNSEISFHKHWSFPNLTETQTPIEEEVDSLIEKAVEKRLMADVPIGALLSGGLDSSTIVAYMSRLGCKINTFSVGFGDNTDETPYAELIASKFNTNHKKIILDKEIISLLPSIVWHFDEPLADPAAVPTYQLCKEVSKNVKVALSGEGGDETFGGYTDFNYIKKIRMLQYIPKPFAKLGAPILKSISSGFKYPRKQQIILASELLNDNKNLFANHKRLLYLPFNEEDKKRILCSQILEKINLRDPVDYYFLKSQNPWNNAINYYFKEWLPNDLLMKGDKMSMAHSLELRMPFLDTNLITYFCKVDNKYKQNRLFFRKVVSKMLPREIMKKKKQGFVLPISNWFTKQKFADRIIPHINDLSDRNIFNKKEIDKIISNLQGFRNDHRIWVLLNFELWAKIYLDSQKISSIRI